MNFYDLAYTLALAISSPIWLIKPKSRRKVLRALRERTGRNIPPQNLSHPAILIHAVSLGEMNATRALVAELSARRPDLHFILSTTTDTGHAQGQKLYAGNPKVTLIRYPLDFSSAITRVLDGLKPSAVVLMELEVWPNFLRQCARRNIPIALINGRITTPACRRYRLITPISRAMFRRLAEVCAQEQLYAERFVSLGAHRDKVRVTGTMKFDNAQIEDSVLGATQLAHDVGLRPIEPLWICGSTGPGEEEVIVEVYKQLLRPFPELRLAIIPRKPERFDEVWDVIHGGRVNVIRRSEPRLPEELSKLRELGRPPVILGDTMGELKKFYSLATVVFVGRSLVDLGPRQHGSDMIEPAALAKPCIVGPFTGNFREVMNAFRQNNAMIEVTTPDQLRDAVADLLSKPDQATQLGQRARTVVQQNQGATRRHADVVLQLLK